LSLEGPFLSTRQNIRKEKENRIIKAAAKVFSRRGFANAVMADIAAEAEIGKGTIYEYFNSKDDLFFAVFEWFMDSIKASAMVIISKEGGSAASQLQALNDSLTNIGKDMEDMFTLFMEFWAASASSAIRTRFKKAFKKAYEDFRRIVSKVVQTGIERKEFINDADPEAIAALLVGSWDGLLLQNWFEEDFDPQTKAEKFLSILIRGLAAQNSTYSDTMPDSSGGSKK
jgi:AcrR family transcriptional regulator